MAPRWLILADDLTGAADCGIAFARRGRAAVVAWGAATIHSDAAGRRPFGDNPRDIGREQVQATCTAVL